MLTLEQDPVFEHKQIQVRVEEANEGVEWRTDDRFTTDVKRRVHKHGAASALVERFQKCSCICFILAGYGLKPCRSINMGNRRNIRTRQCDRGLRGSVPLVIAVYFGLYRFLRDNLSDRRHLTPLLSALLLFETGYTVLTYHRLVYLLTFAILYLDCVAPGQPRLVRAS